MLGELRQMFNTIPNTLDLAKLPLLVYVCLFGRDRSKKLRPVYFAVTGVCSHKFPGNLRGTYFFLRVKVSHKNLIDHSQDG